MPKEATKQSRPTIERLGTPEERREQMAKASLDASKWGSKSAKSLLIQAMKEDPEVLALICAPWINGIAQATMDKYAPHHRNARKKAFMIEADKGSAMSGDVVEIKSRKKYAPRKPAPLMGMSEQTPDWMSAKMLDGTRLSEANAIKLKHEAKSLKDVSEGAAKRAIMYQHLADIIEKEGGKTVSDVANHDTITKLEITIDVKIGALEALE